MLTSTYCRYASLIVFANYLLEKSAELRLDEDSDLEDERPDRSRMKPFREWLQDRREISRILSKKSLE